MKKMKKEMKVKKGNLKKIESVVYAGAIRSMLLVVIMFFLNFNALLPANSSWHLIWALIFFANLMYMCSRVAFLKQDAVLEWITDMCEIAKSTTPVTPVTPIVTPAPVTPAPNTTEIDPTTKSD